MSHKISNRKIIGRFTFFLLFLVALLFGPANTLNWIAVWIYIIIYLCFGIMVLSWLRRNNPELPKERLTFLKKSAKGWDKIIMLAATILFIALFLITGFATAIMLEAAGVIGPELTLYRSGILLPEILQVPQAFLMALVAAFLLVLVLALRRGVGWKIFLVISVIFFFGIATLYYSARPEIVTPPPVQLTPEQIEVHHFVSAFHVAASNHSVTKVIPFFAQDAIMVLPDGTLLKGIDMIKSYYEEEFTRYRQYILSGKASEIEVVDNRATATYSSGLRVWTLGATQPPLTLYREVFTLIRIDDTWKIETLVMTPRGAE